MRLDGADLKCTNASERGCAGNGELMSGRWTRAALLTVLVLIGASVGVIWSSTSAQAKPVFKAPFPCGQTWTASTYPGHVPNVNAVDFNRYPGQADLGQPAIASAPGTAFTSVSGSGSLTVKVDHGAGWMSVYVHLSSFSVSNGAPVTTGQEVGKVGSSGASSPHLHYEQRLNNTPQPVEFDGQRIPVGTTYTPADPGITSTNCGGGGGIPDGSLVRTPNGDIFRIAGGAPLHLSSCAPFNGCAGVIAVNDLSQFASQPRNGTTIATPQSETGRIYKVAGGAPLWLSNCSADCGAPVLVNQWTIDTLNHLNPVPSNGTTLSTPSSETGRIYKVAGGAPLWLSNCSADCGAPVLVNQWTIDTANHLNPVPSNGTTLSTPSSETGRIYKVAGGAPLWLSNCSADCGAPVLVNQWTIDTANHLNPVPSNGTTLSTPSSETGRIYKVAGGAPLWLSNCSADCGAPVLVNQWTIDTANHLTPVIADGTAVRVSDAVKQGWVSRAVGGALIHLSSCAPAEIKPACDALVGVDQGAYDRYATQHPHPVDGTVVRTVPSNSHYVFSNGTCSQAPVGAGAVAVNDGTVQCITTIRNIALPVISGKARVGKTLTTTQGSWSVTGLSVSYQWLRDGVAIPSATGGSHRLRKPDKGHRISVQVIVTKAGYSQSLATAHETKKVKKKRHR